MSKKLFDASDESDSELQLGTNQDYAKSYNNFRKKELLKKFKDKGYDVSESDSSSDSESSDEDEAVDPKFDAEFFKTLASLKSNDPAIYDKNTRFFDSLAAESDSEGDDDNKTKEKKTKPITLKDYERKIILENEGKFEDDSDAEVPSADERPQSPTAVEEERRLKAEFRKVMNADDSEDEEFGGIFKKRQKTKEEREQEEADFVKWLAGKQEDIAEPVKEQLKPLKNYWDNAKLPQSERFLRDYVLNKGYANSKLSEIPTYDEIVGDQEPLSEDEKELEKQAEFEQKYNFRFEEPDADFIQRYPRTIEQSVRRTDDRRKQKRQELKERKQQEKEQKMKEFELVKEMKRKEIEDKIRKLKMVTGNDELGFKTEELEEDFDPEAHDRRMQELFNDDYYQVDEGEEKPECPSDIDELKIEDWDNYDPKRGDDDEGDDFEPHCEDDDFNMDCDYDPAKAKEDLQKELIESTKKRKTRKGRRNRFMEMIQQEKPAFDPEDEKTYAEYIDEYYQMDCEDIIDDIPCRFKYVETTPNDFGLSIEEILLAKNKELNQWASLKKAIQIRPDFVEKKEQRLYKMKAKNEELKRKIFKSLYGDGSDDEEENAENGEQPGGSEQSAQSNTGADTEAQLAPAGESKKAKKKKKRKAQAAVTAVSLNDASKTTNEKAEESETKKIKLDENSEDKSATAATPVNDVQGSQATVNKKKKKKRKNKANTEQQTQNTPQNENSNKMQQPQKTKPQNEKSNNMQQAKNGKAKQQNPKKQTEINKPGTSTAQSSTNAKANPFKKGDAAKSGNSGKTNNPFSKGANNAKLHKVNGGKVAKAKSKFNKSDNKQKFNIKVNGNDAKISDERLKAYGINPRKFAKKQKYGKQQN